MNEFDALMAKIENENRAEEANSPAPSADKVASEAKFLKKWAKGKPIRRQTDSSTFWAAGKWMTKMTYKMADALVAGGYATANGDTKQGGTSLKML